MMRNFLVAISVVWIAFALFSDHEMTQRLRSGEWPAECALTFPEHMLVPAVAVAFIFKGDLGGDSSCENGGLE